MWVRLVEAEKVICPAFQDTVFLADLKIFLYATHKVFNKTWDHSEQDMYQHAEALGTGRFMMQRWL